MRITAVRIPAGFGDRGLQAIEMSGLGQVVLLVGPNGAGKSRLLNIVNEANRRPAAAEMQSLRMNLSALRIQAKNPNLGPTHRTAVSQQLIGQEKAIALHEMFDVEPADGDAPAIVPFVPRAELLRNPDTVLPREQAGAKQRLMSGAVRDAHAETLLYIQRTQQIFRNANDTNVAATAAERELARADYERLRLLVEELMGSELAYDIEGQPLLFERPPESFALSDGQRILLQLAVLLHVRGASLRDCVILLDEPETHLHPKALIDVFQRLTSCTVSAENLARLSALLLTPQHDAYRSTPLR
jgi:energy-coupling factor transporter ATP-binding protein EcfA2